MGVKALSLSPITRRRLYTLRAATLRSTACSWGEGALDRIEVGGLWREEHQSCARCLGGVTSGGSIVNRQVVEHHDVAGPKRRRERPLDISEELLAAHLTVENHGRDHTGQAQRAGKGSCRTVAIRDAGPKPLPAWCPAVDPRHLGSAPDLFDEYEGKGIKVKLAFDHSWRRLMISGRSYSAACSDYSSA